MVDERTLNPGDSLKSNTLDGMGSVRSYEWDQTSRWVQVPPGTYKIVGRTADIIGVNWLWLSERRIIETLPIEITIT